MEEEIEDLKKELSFYKNLINIEAINSIKQESEDTKSLLSDQRQITSQLQHYISNLDVKFNVLQQVGKAVVSGKDLDELLDSLVTTVMDAVKVEAGSLLLVNEEEKILEFKIAKGAKSEEVKKYKIPLGEGVVG